MPLIATSRIHEPAEAEALLAAGAADAVGMTRALIADPDLPRRIVDGREDERILCTGCNQGCIGHYHLGLPISCLQNPRTGRERTLPEPGAAGRLARARGRRRPRRHGGRRGRGARAGAEVTLVEAGAALGGQFALAGRAPAHRETARALPGRLARRLAAAGVTCGWRRGSMPDSALATRADRVIVATGAVAHRPPLTAPAGVAVSTPGTPSARPSASPGPCSWPTGAAAGPASTPPRRSPRRACACGSPSRRRSWARPSTSTSASSTSRASSGSASRSCTTASSSDAPGGAVLRSLWTHATEPLPAGVRTLVLALGREPVDDLVHALGERGVACTPVGDCRGARSLEEAILEGTAAGEQPPRSRSSHACTAASQRRAELTDVLSGSPERSSVACASSRMSSVMSRLAL